MTTSLRHLKHFIDNPSRISSMPLKNMNKLANRLYGWLNPLQPRTWSSMSSMMTNAMTERIQQRTRKGQETVRTRPKFNSDLHLHHFHTSHLLDSENKFEPTELTELQYESLVEVTLNSLCDFFDELPEIASCVDEYEAEFSGGVLTVHFSTADGTYVINKQTPNKQIWLSSPKTGPKRYDFCGGKWIYSRDGVGLHQVLEEEMSEIFGSKISMKDCKHYS